MLRVDCHVTVGGYSLRAPRAHSQLRQRQSDVRRLVSVIERVCVVGAGSIGSIFAGHLAQVADVSILTRRQAEADALNNDGLRISGRSNFRAPVAASVDPAELTSPDLVIVATKAPGLEDAAVAMEGHFADATVMTTLNGLGAEEVVRAHGDWPIISAVTFMSGTRHDDAHVEYILDTETWLGPYEDTPYETVEAAGALIAAAGLKVEVMRDLRPAQWSKLIFNATVNSVAALQAFPMTSISQQRRLRPISVTWSTTSSTRARPSRQQPGSSSTTTRGK